MENTKVPGRARAMVMEKNVHIQKEKVVVKTDHAEVLEMAKESHL
jgi:hypothetical protein